MKRLPETLNESEIKALLSQPNNRARTGLRDQAIILLMLNDGLRAGEKLAHGMEIFTRQEVVKELMWGTD